MESLVAMATARAKARAEVTVLVNASIVTMDSERRVFVGNGAIVVEGDKIVAIGKTDEVLREYEGKADSVLDLSSRWVLPGIASHTLLLHFGPVPLALCQSAIAHQFGMESMHTLWASNW